MLLRLIDHEGREAVEKLAHCLSVRSKFRHRIQCGFHILDPGITFLATNFEGHMSLPHARMSALLAVSLSTAGALNQE